MERRELIVAAGAGALAALAGSGRDRPVAAEPGSVREAAADAVSAGQAAGPGALPRRAEIRVAFMLGQSANVIDTAGPWEVFQDVMTEPGHNHPFRLYTVGASREVVTMTGGLKVQPDHDVASAPQPHVIVAPAQRSSPELLAWLRRASAGADVTMSVCTGAFQLARAGLLQGIPATTHHDYWDAFAQEFPSIELRRGPRFVDSGRIATAGGLTSGVDLALHMVRRYFGEQVAANTATYMEHASQAWRV